jgi:hypothetical protein
MVRLVHDSDLVGGEMASAEKAKIEIVTEVEGVALTLTAFEASVLLRVVRKIGGSPYEGSPRGATDNITRALTSIGVEQADVIADGSIMLDNPGLITR